MFCKLTGVEISEYGIDFPQLTCIEVIRVSFRENLDGGIFLLYLEIGNLGDIYLDV